MSTIFNEPHSTKPYEDGVHYGWATNAEWLDWCRKAWVGNDVRELARRVRCPTLVIHGDEDRRVPYAKGQAIHALVPGSKMLTIAGGGHVTAARDPVAFNRALSEFVGGAPRPTHLGARHVAPAPRAVHLQPHRPGPCAARPGHRARAAQAAAGSGDRLVHRRPRCAATSSAKANASTRSPGAWPTRAATSSRSPASTTCRPSSHCARWTRS